MTKDELIAKWHEYYKSTYGIPQSIVVSDTEVLEQLAIVAYQNNNLTNPFVVKMKQEIN